MKEELTFDVVMAYIDQLVDQYRISGAENLKFNYYRHRWDPFVPGGQDIK